MEQNMKDVIALGVMMFGTYFTGYYVGRIFGHEKAYNNFRKLRADWEDIIKEYDKIIKDLKLRLYT